MNPIRVTCAAPALFLIAMLPIPAQSQAGAPVTLKAVKYAGLAKTVAQNRGKVVVVDLWGVFCKPCKEKFPHLVAMHKKYADKGLAAVSVSLDEPGARTQAERFLIANQAAFTNLWLDEPPEVWTQKFRTDSLPCVFVYDRRGKWIQFKSEGDKDVDYAEIEKLVVQLLAE